MEFFADFASAFPRNYESQYFAFSLTQFRTQGPQGEGLRDGWRQKSISVMHLLYRSYEDVMRHALDEIAHSSRLQGLVDIFISFIGCHDYDFCRRFLTPNVPDSLDAVAIGQT